MNLIALKERIAISDAFSNDERMFLLTAINMMPEMDIEYHDPGNAPMGRIDSLWAYLSIGDGGEGLCAAPVRGIGTMPLIAADRRRLQDIRPLAVSVAKIFRKPVRLARFKQREDVEIIRP